MKKALVIGFGSIGKLHREVLASMGYDVRVVSEHMSVGGMFFDSLNQACSSDLDYVVIASTTARHKDDLKELHRLGYRGKVLVEKPVFGELVEDCEFDFESLHVGYNLRFHPGVEALRQELSDRQVLTVQHYVGQHLSLWRPDSDHKQSYSANAAKGGGVLRDLSHELDLMLHLFGKPHRITGFGGRYGDVTVDAEDAFGVLMALERCPLAVLQMNYLDWHSGRQLRVVCEDTTLLLDFSAGMLRVGDNVSQFDVDRPLTYERMHKNILDGDRIQASTLEEGLEILRQIELLEKV